MQIQKFVIGLIAVAILAMASALLAGFGAWKTMLFAVAVIVAMQLCYVAFVVIAARGAAGARQPRQEREPLTTRRSLAVDERPR